MPEIGPVDPYSRLEQTTYTRGNVGGLCVAVVGCGALGAEAARLLGLLGVGSVLLIDHDRVEATNLTHSPYLRAADSIGRYKAEVLAEALAVPFPETRWMAVPQAIADVGFGRLRAAGLLFSCTDNALARVETCYAARRLRLPMMDAGLKGRAFWAGRVAWFPAEAGGCYLCQLSAGTRAELLSLSLAASQSCSVAGPEEEALPSTPTMASLVAAMQVDLALRLLLAPEPVREAQAWELSLRLPETAWSSFTIPQSADCPWHEFPAPPTLVALPSEVALAESLGKEGQSARVLELDWPVSLRARCAGCQQVFAPMLRLAALRRLRCPVCGGARLHSVETLATVAGTDEAAQYSPAQLGLPAEHLFTLKPL